MTLDRLGRWRLPVLAALSILVALGVVIAILLLGRAPSALDGSPSPRPSASSASSSATPGSTPESAIRAFYDALAKARRTDDPSIVEPFVNGTDSSAYLTAAGFLEGQRGLGKASVVTVLELSDFQVTIEGTRATVRFTLREGGYDIDLKTGERLETPMVLPEKRVEAELVLVSGTWLVDGYGAIK
ncbi:MAG: hypothetical protein H0W81_12875 [Chloroflexi bacterium]|nr:hypothetical protein [Chloroflexota bacterium]